MSVTQQDIKYCRCGGPCDFYETTTRWPCWGRVHVVDDEAFIHACEGHAPAWQEDGYHVEAYVPEPG